jgi:anhydro-N-acetylmuramic acid kinase
MSQLVKKKIIYNFRQEDMINKGQGAPLTPIFHNLLSKKINEKSPNRFSYLFFKYWRNF